MCDDVSQRKRAFVAVRFAVLAVLHKGVVQDGEAESR